MEDAGFIITCYVLTLGGAALYALTVIRRGKKLARRLPDEDKPWLD